MHETPDADESECTRVLPRTSPAANSRYARLACCACVPDEELAARLGHVRVPVLFLMSLADEYVPPQTDQLAQATRQAQAMRMAPISQARVAHVG